MTSKATERLVDRFRQWMAEQQDDLRENEDPLWMCTEAKRVGDPELNDTEGIKILFYWPVDFVSMVLEEEGILENCSDVSAWVDPHHIDRSYVLAVYKRSFVLDISSAKHWHLFGMSDDEIDEWLRRIRHDIAEGLAWAKGQPRRPER